MVTAENGRVVDAKVALTGAAEYPTRLEAVEKALLNRPATDEQIASAAAASYEGLAFRGDAFASAEYRRHLTRVLTDRALKQALSRTTS